MTTPAPPPGNRMPTEGELRERLRPLADTGCTMAEASDGVARLGEVIRSRSHGIAGAGADSVASREALMAEARARMLRADRNP